MSSTDSVIEGSDPAWIVVDTRQSLSLGLLQEAAEGLSSTTSPEGRSEALADQATQALARVAPGAVDGDPTLRARLIAAAQAICLLPAARWACPSLPWYPAEGAPAAPCLLLAGNVDLRIAATPGVELEPAAVALLAALGAFGNRLPATLRMNRLAAAGGPPPRLQLLLLNQASGASAADTEAARLERQVLETLSDAAPTADEVVVISFLVDDQSPEDLAIGLGRVRAVEGVLDVSTTVAYGKKERLAFRVEVLARPAGAPGAVRACLAETTTIGLRWQLERRVVLRREMQFSTGSGGQTGAVKFVVRPGGQYSGKVEADVLSAAALDRVGRQELRSELESAKRS